MSHKLINHNPDLKRLRDEGYEVDVYGQYLLVHNIPYVNSQKEVNKGILVTALELSGDKTLRPSDHVIHFKGEEPCDKDGNIIKGIQHQNEKKTLGDNIEVDRSFSNKPSEGYSDYYEKVTMYARIISSHAIAIDPKSTPTTFRVIETTDLECVHRYLDTNSSRAEILSISSKLEGLKIAIIGVGGTGSYILDLVSKTQVKEIHIFDDDLFSSHNAFRSPGAASVDQLMENPKKVHHFQKIYSQMHKNIFVHEYNVTNENVNELTDMSFVFICIDRGEARKLIIGKLMQVGIPFIDVGVGIYEVDGSLTGSLRVTTVTDKANNHFQGTIPFTDGVDDIYTKNIQIAEINMLNASLAVIRWKKIFGFYHDFGKEYNSVYNINNNQLVNDDIAT